MKIRTIIAAFVLAAVALTSTTVFAAEPAVKVKEIDFEEDYLLGEIATADGLFTEAQEERDLASLVSAREDFVGKLLKAVEDL